MDVIPFQQIRADLGRARPVSNSQRHATVYFPITPGIHWRWCLLRPLELDAKSEEGNHARWYHAQSTTKGVASGLRSLLGDRRFAGPVKARGFAVSRATDSLVLRSWVRIWPAMCPPDQSQLRAPVDLAPRSAVLTTGAQAHRCWKCKKKSCGPEGECASMATTQSRVMRSYTNRTNRFCRRAGCVLAPANDNRRNPNLQPNAA